MAEAVKIPPHNVEAEEAVLGAVLLDGDSLSRVSGFLSSQDFYKTSNELIFRAMQRLQARHAPIDALTVTEDLKSRGELDKVGGATYITGLSEGVVSAANITAHAQQIKDYARRRRVLNFSRDLQERCYNGGLDPAEVESGLLDLFKDSRIGKDNSLEAIDKTVWEGLERVSRNPGTYRGLPTGFFDLDRITGGMPRGEMIVLAARPSVGKTSLTLSIAANVAAAGKRVGVVSLEMSGEHLYQRLLFQTARMDSQKYNEGSLTKNDLALLNDFRDTLKSLPLVIRDNVGNRIESVVAAARRLKIIHKIDLLVVDYLQLIRGPGEKLYESITNVSGELKALARRLDIPVLVACQINRKVEDRPDRKPRMSDLRDSGAIEQDADQIWLIHRPECYGIINDKEGNDLKGRAEIIVSKNRNGRTGAAWLAFISKYAGFENLA